MAIEDDDDRGCCSVFFLKGVLVVFNFLFGLIGCVLIGVSLWTLLDKSAYMGVMSSEVFTATTYILLATGIAAVILAIIGCAGTVREIRCLLLTYGFLVMVVFIVEAIAAVLAFLYSKTVHLELVRTFNQTLVKEYNYKDRVTKSIDRLQKDLQCCGSDGYRDWRHSKWFLDSTENTEGLHLPDTCCKTLTRNCGISAHPSNINEWGCVNKLEMYLRDHLFILGIVAVAAAVLQLLGIIFSCCLVRQIHVRKRRLKYKPPEDELRHAPLMPPPPPPQHNYLPPPNYPYAPYSSSSATSNF